jgi:hypothetical protein
MYIHAFDPGENTGYCLLQCCLGVGHIHVTGSKTLTLYQELAWVAETFQSTKPNIVVIEAWRLYPHKALSQIGSKMPAAEQAGIIKYLCWLHNIEWVEQMASCKQAFESPNVIAQVLPGYTLPKSEHEKDALRHALYYWFNTGRHQ